MTRVSYSSCGVTEDEDDFLHRTIRRSAKPLSMLGNKKFKAKEERKRVLKMSVSKLKDIDDPETFLRRSVLINNTMKRLQSEVRLEKSGVKNIFYERLLTEEKGGELPSNNHHPPSSSSEDEEDEEEEEEIDVSSPPSVDIISTESDSDLLLKEVYMPPPISPVLDHDVLSRRWFDSGSSNHCGSTSSSSSSSSLDNNNHLSDIPSASTISSNGSPSASNNNMNNGYLPDKTMISCGQSSLFGELQTVVFNSLIASLET